MKRNLLYLLSIALLAFMVACTPGTETDDETVESTVEESAETDETSEVEESESVVTSETEESEEVSEEVSEETSEEESEATGDATDGTYTASKPGMNDDIEVSVEIKDGKIASVEVTSESETPGIGSPLKTEGGEVLEFGGKTPVQLIPELIVEQQTLEVDNVSGATITSASIRNAVKDCLEQANVDPASLTKVEAEQTPAEEMTADIVVVGGGGTGLAAAIAAEQQGSSVIIIEKNGSVGGNTLVCGAIYNAPNEELQSAVEMTDEVKNIIETALAEEPVDDAHAELQAEVQAQWDQYQEEGRTDLFDTKEWYALQTWINGDKVGNLDLVKVLTYNSKDGLDWIQELGMNFSDEISQGAGSLWQRTHTSTMDMGTGFISTYVENIQGSDNVDVLVETKATELIQDDSGRVVGVKCVDQFDNEFTVSANQGVIITTGGFGANSEMVQNFNTAGKWEDLSEVPTTNRSSTSGDGITMVQELEPKASLTDMEQLQLLYLGNLKDGQLTKYPPRNVNGTDQVIFINKDGERFVREDGRRDEICLAVLQQPDQFFYYLESGDGEGYIDINDPDWRSADGFTFDYLLDNGYILTADSLDEIAEKIGADPATLQATVDEFNAAVGGAEDEYGRKLFSTTLENGPWVATSRQACIHHTMGGITIDTETRVLDENGEPIPGLYAGGEVVGGIHGANRLGGNAVVDTVVFGKLAGETAATENER